jgi:hypothetical protein
MRPFPVLIAHLLLISGVPVGSLAAISHPEGPSDPLARVRSEAVVPPLGWYRQEIVGQPTEGMKEVARDARLRIAVAPVADPAWLRFFERALGHQFTKEQTTLLIASDRNSKPERAFAGLGSAGLNFAAAAYWKRTGQEDGLRRHTFHQRAVNVENRLGYMERFWSKHGLSLSAPPAGAWMNFGHITTLVSAFLLQANRLSLLEGFARPQLDHLFGPVETESVLAKRLIPIPPVAVPYTRALFEIGSRYGLRERAFREAIHWQWEPKDAVILAHAKRAEAVLGDALADLLVSRELSRDGVGTESVGAIRRKMGRRWIQATIVDQLLDPVESPFPLVNDDMKSQLFEAFLAAIYLSNHGPQALAQTERFFLDVYLRLLDTYLGDADLDNITPFVQGWAAHRVQAPYILRLAA